MKSIAHNLEAITESMERDGHKIRRPLVGATTRKVMEVLNEAQLTPEETTIILGAMAQTLRDAHAGPQSSIPVDFDALRKRKLS
jgi:hypothetical protein